MHNHRTKPKRNARAFLLLGWLVSQVTPAAAEEIAGIADSTDNLVGLPNGGLQPTESFRAYIGQAQPPRQSVDTSTGRQMYFGGFEYRRDGPWQFGASVAIFDDPPTQTVDGRNDSITYVGFGLDGKLRVFEGERLAIAVAAGLETVDYSRGGSLPGLGNVADGDRERLLLTTISVPITYQLSNPFWIAGELGYTQAADTAGSGQGFGRRSFATLGFGYQATERQTYYAAAKAVSFGLEDALDAPDGRATQMLYTVGAQYHLTPQSALNLYLTNAFSPTQTGDDLSFFMQPNDAVLGVLLNYIPSGRGVGNAATTFRPVIQPYNPTAQFADTITTKGPHTLASDRARVRLSLGAEGQRAISLHYVPDPDFQFDFSFEDLSLGAGSDFRSEADEDIRYFIGGRWSAMNEAYGDPISLGFGITAGRDFKAPTVGSLSLSASASKDFEWGAAGLSAQSAIFADTTLTGIGTMLRYDLGERFRIMGEASVVRDSDAVWSAGVRYQQPFAGYAVDIYTTNAASFSGVGALLSNDRPQIGMSLHWEFGADLL